MPEAHDEPDPQEPQEPQGWSEAAGAGEIHQPHDKLFKASFSKPENAASFLKTILPPRLVQRMDWDSLELLSGDFIDSHFRLSQSDLLFAVKIDGRPARLLLLVEHQRSPERWMPLRLLRYQVRIWEDFIAKHPDAQALPVILPVVVAQNGTRWEMPEWFRDLVWPAGEVDEDLAQFVPDFTFRLIQLAELPYEQIGGTPDAVLTLRVLKAEQMGQLLGEEVWDRAVFAAVQRETMEWVLRYLIYAADIKVRDLDAEVTKLNLPQTQRSFMTVAEQLIQRGREEAMTAAERRIEQERSLALSEGRLNAHRQSLLAVLESRFGELPIELVESIERVASEARLMDMLRAAVTVASLAEFARDSQR
jgi:predicted transposase YdaD